MIGFVDQEDALMRTLTVYETVLYSALLRLPREMSLEAKKFRTLETMNELGILEIKDTKIGDSGAFCLFFSVPESTYISVGRTEDDFRWRKATLIHRLRAGHKSFYLVFGRTHER
jgi:hypothetical protein